MTLQNERGEPWFEREAAPSPDRPLWNSPGTVPEWPGFYEVSQHVERVDNEVLRTSANVEYKAIVYWDGQHWCRPVISSSSALRFARDIRNDYPWRLVSGGL